MPKREGLKIETARSLSLNDVLLLGFICWFGSYAYQYVSVIGGPNPIYSYVALLAFALLYVLQRAALHRPAIAKQDRWLWYFMIWLGAYLVYGALEFLHSIGDRIALQALIRLVGAALLAGAFTVLMAGPRRLRVVTAVLAVLAIVGAVMDVADFVHPTFSNVPGRAAGLYVNPTIAGNFVALAMVAGINVVRRRLRLPYLLVCGIGVLVTFSRESWIIWGLAVVWLGWQGYFGSARQRRVTIVLAAMIGGGSGVLLFAGQVGTLVANSSLQEYLTPNTAARLGIDASVITGESVQERQSLVLASLHEAAKAPWLGRGLGFTEEWKYSQGPHNMYLLFFVEGGALGLMLYLALVLLLCMAGVGAGRVIAVQIVISSLFSHNHLEQPAILLIMAFVFAHGAVARREARQIGRSHRTAIT